MFKLLKKHPMINKIILFALSIFTFQTSYSQLIGGEAFLQGTYLEVGIADCGSYGTAGAPPAGYHANSTTGALGFVADPDQDGWLVGTPAYFGDYFLPGTPLEGWGLEFNGNTYYNANSGTICTDDDIPGTITNYSSTLATQSATWNGAVAGVNVKMRTWFPTDALYFITDVTLYNTTGSDIYDLYFLRHVDPDNEQTNGGSFITEQNIVFQPDSTNCAALVSATGEDYGAYLGLGTMNPNAIVAYHDGLSINMPTTIADVYNGVAPAFITGGNNINDEPMSLTFKVDTLLAGDSITLSYAYILDSLQLFDALAQTGATFISVDGVDITSTLTYSYCPLTPLLINLQISGGYNWVWSGPNLVSNTGDSVMAVLNGNAIYTVTGTSYTCGDILRTIIVLADSNLIANAGPDVTICNGDSVQLLGSGEGNFVWSPSTGVSDVNIAQPMVYTTTSPVTYTLNTSCGTDDVNVTIIPDLSTSFLPIDTICMFGSENIQLVTSPPSVLIDSIIWSDASTLNTYFGNTVTASPIITTTYYTTATSVDGCVVEDSITLFVEGQAPNIAIYPSDTTICLGQSYAIDANYYSLTDEYTISTPVYSSVPGSGISVSLGDDQLSTALPIGFNFSFYGNNYTQFYISSNGYITFSPGGGSGCCSGQSLPNTATPNNLIAFAWEDLNPSAGGTIEYFVTGTSPNQMLVINFINVPHYGGGNLVSAQVVLYENSNQIAINIANQPDAFGTTTLGLENIDGTEATFPVGYNATQWTASNLSWIFTPYTPSVLDFSWSPSIYLDVDTGLNVVSSLTETTTYTLTADNGVCVSTASITINIDSSISIINATDDISTCNTDDKELFINVSSSSPVTYTWTPSTDLNCTNCDTVISSSLTDICYTVEVSSTMSTCVILDTVCIGYNNTLNIDSLIAENVSCLGFTDGEISVYASSGNIPYSYSMDGTTFISSNSFNGLSAGTYAITVEDDLECLQTSSITIVEPTEINIEYTTRDTACYHNSDAVVEITVSGGVSANGQYSYSFNSSVNTTSTIPITIENLLGDSTYSFSVQDDNNCTVSSDIYVQEFPALEITVSADSCNFYGETVNLGVSGNYVSYNWTPITNLSCSDCPDPIATVYETTDYSLVVTDVNGCENINDVNINVCLLLTEIMLPDAFSPNGDGLNDRFFDESLIPPGYDLVVLNIYNRWGSLVYTRETLEGWDGTFKGIDQDGDMYIYYITFKTKDGDLKQFSGNISLLR